MLLPGPDVSTLNVSINTKKQRYGNGHGNINKMLATRIERYGNKGCNAKQAVKTRKVKYGNAAGNIAKMSETCMQRYGVPWHCMTAKCRNAQGRVKLGHKEVSSKNAEDK